MNTQSKNSLNYQDAGVNIDAGMHLIDKIKPFVQKTHNAQVLSGLGGFGALFELPEGYKKPVLVSGTDGVGTKLKLATQLQRHQTIGIDLVAMCANDIIVQGAKPLFFLDYYATGVLDVDLATQIIQGITDGCLLANMALVGGETAEMPGHYAGQDYDLAGFCVGIVEKDRMLDGLQAKPGDQLIAIPSSGPHSNGYSLIRKILETYAGTWQDIVLDDGKSLDDALIEPTRIYCQAINALTDRLDIHAISHITGGGISDNLPRVLPANCCADIQDWSWPAVFHWLQNQGQVEKSEMLRTFNCGIGMIVAVPTAQSQEALSILADNGEPDCWVLGSLSAIDDGQPQVKISG